MKTFILVALLTPALVSAASLSIPVNDVIVNGQRIPAADITSMLYKSGNINVTANGWSVVRDGQPTPVQPVKPAPTKPTPTKKCSTTLKNTARPKSWSRFWGVDFPEPGNAIKRLDVGRTGYNYIKFNTGNANGNGIVYLIETTDSPDGRLGSISECAGDFNVAKTCTASWGIDAWIAYTTSGRAGRCQLKKDTDYYLNFTFTNGKRAATSTCKSRRCLVEIQTGFKPE